MAKEPDNISYKVVKIHTTRFSIEDMEEERLNEIVADNENPNLNIKIGISAQKEKSTVTFDITSYFLSPEDKTKPLVTHTARTVFYIKNMKDFYEKETEKVNIPDPATVQFLGISFSHARAALAIELSSTVYRDKYFLPVVDPLVLFNKLLDKKEA
ncbi:MAG TPA: hypothetical protein DDY13_11835 [Cytophagales bacterium]|jgi:hypothetical protein|nr:hypothetical protein [Cytophagales bacterium]